MCCVETRVFATNSLTILPEVDVIVVMKDGRIHETGTYDELRMNGGEFAKLLQEHTEEKARHREATTLNGKHVLIVCASVKYLVAWHSGRTSVSDRRTFPVLRLTCS